MSRKGVEWLQDRLEVLVRILEEVLDVLQTGNSAYSFLVSDGVSVSAMRKRADKRGDPAHDHEMNYILELSRDGKILGGEWTKDPTYAWGDDSKKAHPDFLWAAIKPAGYGGRIQRRNPPTDDSYSLPYPDRFAQIDLA